jgi:hypothetical protein
MTDYGNHEETTLMKVDMEVVEALERELDQPTRERVMTAVDRIVDAKKRGGNVAVVTGSGPNIHEGITTLIAELIRLGVVDGVTTSSAVVAHEMAGVLDRVKRVDGSKLGLAPGILPRDGSFELTLLDDETLALIAAEMPVDMPLIDRLREAPGDEVIKAAGNLGYPMGLRTERIAKEVLELARARAATFEEIAGAGADERTMIGIGATRNVPVLVTIPQLVGGGAVGTAIGDSTTINERTARIARLLDGADVIIESAVALTQEVHDGPLETHTGHGLWAAWQGRETFSLRGKTLIRIDLDTALDRVWQAERQDRRVQETINRGLPKTKVFGVPFRMEMSGFARLEGSIPIIGDIGVVWPIIARHCAERLGLTLRFMSYPQESESGRTMRDWIVREVRPLNRQRMLDACRTQAARSGTLAGYQDE